MNKKRLLFFKLIFSFIIILPLSLYSFNILKINISGNTDIVNLDKIKNRKKIYKNEKDIRGVISEIINLYQSKGYGAVRIIKVVIKSDSVNIIIDEGRIGSVEVKGADKKKSDKIKEFISRELNFYNTFILKKRLKDAVKMFNLDTIKIYPDRSEDGKIKLLVKVNIKRGKFYGKVYTDVAYGLIPLIGYLYNFDDYIINSTASCGIKESSIRKVYVDSEFYWLLNRDRIGLFFKLSGGRNVDIWQSQFKEYDTNYILPGMGIKYIYSPFEMKISLNEKLSRINNYNEKRLNVYSSSIDFNILISNRYKILDIREMWILSLTLSTDWNNLENNIYIVSQLHGSKPFLLTDWFRLISSMRIFYTSASNRLFWEYVYDIYLPGFDNRYDASKMKNSLSLFLEFELHEDMIYMGPYSGTSVFLNENSNWSFKSGGGLKVIFRYGRVIVDIFYAWDLEGSPLKGSLYISAEGKF